MSATPELTDMKFDGTSTAFSVDSVHYAGLNGVTVQLSEFGVEKIEDPQFHDLLMTSIHAVAVGRHPEPSATGAEVIKIADPQRRNMSSVYSSGSFIVKMGLDINEGPIQFGAMNWLHDTLPQVSDKVKAPAQYALIRSRSGQHTTIMERAVGTSLQEAIHPFVEGLSRNDARALRSESVRSVKTAVVEAIGATASNALMNDVDQNGHVGNIILGDNGGSITVIDQPSFSRQKDRLLLPHVYKRLLKQHTRTHAHSA